MNQHTLRQVTVKPLDANVLSERTGEVFGSLYLTLISIVQGVAFAFLVYKVSENEGISPNAYQIATSLIIVLVTLEYLTVTTFFRWPLSLLDIMIPFALGVGQVFPLAHSANPEHWWTGIAFLATCGIIGYVHSVFRAGREKFDGPQARSAHRLTRWVLISSAAICAALVPLALYFSRIVSPTSQAASLYFFIVLLVLMIAKEQWWCWRMYRVHNLLYR